MLPEFEQGNQNFETIHQTFYRFFSFYCLFQQKCFILLRPFISPAFEAKISYKTMFIPFLRRKALILTLFSVYTTLACAQKAGLEVTRCSAVDRALTLKNVTVDATGRCFAVNSKGIFQVRANDLATPVTVKTGEKNVLSFKRGNADFSWSEAKFREQVTTPCSVTAAWYDSKSQTLWLGTDEAGLFQFSTDPELKLVQQYLPVNSKLKSAHITTLFQDAAGRLWAGNEAGVMYGTPGRWKDALNGFSVQRVREYNTVIYVLADGYISKAPGGEKWSDLALNEKSLEGDINDFDIDETGKMWIVSGVLTRFDLISGTYDVFGGPEYYTSQYGNFVAVAPSGVVWVGTEDKGLFSVDKASNMVLNAYVESPISCEGNGKDAILTAKITGGTPPFSYAWSGGLSGEQPHNIGAGTYSVTVTDSKGVTRTAEIPVPDSRLKVTVKQKKPASASTAADGSAEVDIATNASGIVIAWDNGENRVNATKLTPGEHKVSVTDPKGCAMTLTVTITEAGKPLSASVAVESPVVCSGQTGILAVTASGGKPPYTYTWSNPSLSGEKPAAPAGNYTITVTDKAGASVTASASLSQPQALVLNTVAQAPANGGAADGKALAQAKGGTGVYAFKWDNGETTYNADKLTEGVHQVTATDANGCVMTASVKIEAKVDALSVILRETKPINCAGEKAILSVAAVGGKPPYRDYVWSPEIKSPADGVVAGVYTVTVTDAMGTTATGSINIKEPKKLGASTVLQAGTSPGKEDGKALAIVEGGTGTMFFKWDNDEITAATNHLSPGLHQVTITDESGCTATTSVMIPEGVASLSAEIKETDPIKCASEKARLEVLATGGKSPYRYAWSNPALTGDHPVAPAGDYQLTVSDNSGKTATAVISVKQPVALTASTEITSAASPGGVDGKAIVKTAGGTSPYSYKWTNGESTAEATKLAAGTYTVVITDAQGCSASNSVVMTENILPLVVKINPEGAIKCAGDKITLNVAVTGGKAPFRYAWNSPNVESGKPVALPTGTYLVTVTDAAGTSATASTAVKQPDPLTATVEVQSPASADHQDGKALAKPAGGTAPYIYAWSSGESTNTAARLAPGAQSVKVTDANGCTTTGTMEIGETVLDLNISLTEKTPIRCAGEKAVLAVKVSGGKAPVSFKWNNPALTGDAPAGLDGGDYAVTVTDGRGATKTAEISVKAPSPLEATLTRNIGASSDKSADGKAEVRVSGGTPEYSIVWDTKQKGSIAQHLPLGKHTVTITDANGCSQTIDFETEKRILPELASAVREGQTIQMRRLNFDTDSATIKSDALPMLDELVDFMNQNPGIMIEIDGHTNNLPGEAFADQLSTARAKAVADYLAEKGIDSKRLVYKGFGKRLPLVPNTSPEGRRINQRVEIKVLKMKE